MTYDTYRPLLGAQVRGVLAQWIIARNPRSAMEDSCRHFYERGRPDLAKNLKEGWCDIEAAAASYAALRSPASAHGNTEGPKTETVPPLGKEPLDPEAAATILGVTSSMVRQYLRAGRLAGTNVGGRWFITPEAVNQFRLERRS